MAYDQIVDSEIINTGLTSIANAIRTKGNTSALLSFPNGFVDAVNALGEGSGPSEVDLLKYATRLGNIFSSSDNLPQKISIAPIKLASGNNNGSMLYRAYETGKNTATIDFTAVFNQNTEFSLQQLLHQAYGVKTVTITGNLNKVTSYQNMLQESRASEINITFDFSSCTSDTAGVINSSTTANNLVTEMRFVPNTASYNINLLGFSALDSASLISLANCLVAGVSKTVTLHATPKASLASIIGTVTNGTFEEDVQGTITLSDFITNVKGWILA